MEQYFEWTDHLDGIFTLNKVSNPDEYLVRIIPDRYREGYRVDKTDSLHIFWEALSQEVFSLEKAQLYAEGYARGQEFFSSAH